jgi:conjugative transfer signal peptidase TraF
MKRRIALGMAFGIAAVACSFFGHPHLVWNTTASMPTGLYLLHRSFPARAQMVLIDPPPAVRRLAIARGYLGPRSTLLKTVVALQGDRVCRWGSAVWVSGNRIAAARVADARHRLLPAWRGCQVLGHGEVFVLGHASSSFDSRYFGSIDARWIIGVAVPIWTVPFPCR